MTTKLLYSTVLLALSFTLGCGASHDAADTTAHVVINEVMPANQATCADEQGGYADWLELYNPMDAPVDLAGYSVSDNPATPRKAVLPAGLTIAANGVLVLWTDADVGDGPTHLPFNLSKAGEQILLFDPAGKLLDDFTWTAANSDVSYARAPDGSGALVTCTHPTCGALNGTACAK